VKPLVLEMDERQTMDKAVIKGMFDLGVRRCTPRARRCCSADPNLRRHVAPAWVGGLPVVQIMGIETASDYGGTNASFTSAILAIEGLSCRGRACIL